MSLAREEAALDEARDPFSEGPRRGWSSMGEMPAAKVCERMGGRASKFPLLSGGVIGSPRVGGRKPSGRKAPLL